MIKHKLIKKNTYISRYGDFCANNDNDDTTDYFTPCACAWGNDYFNEQMVHGGLQVVANDQNVVGTTKQDQSK